MASAQVGAVAVKHTMLVERRADGDPATPTERLVVSAWFELDGTEVTDPARIAALEHRSGGNSMATFREGQEVEVVVDGDAILTGTVFLVDEAGGVLMVRDEQGLPRGVPLAAVKAIKPTKKGDD